MGFNKSVDSEKMSENMKIGGKILLTLAIALLLWIVYYLGCPAISLGHFESFMFIALCAISTISIIAMWFSKNKPYETFGAAFCIGLIVAVVIALIALIISIPAFHGGTSRAQLGTPKEIEFDEMIHQIDVSQIPIVDEELAIKQADKKLGEDIALGSRVELGDPAIQEVNGEIMWVIPLEHTDPIKWFTFHSTPGYITVSASNPNKVTYVKAIEGEDIQINYSRQSCFSNNLTRHIRKEGYIKEGLTEYTFEIDDNGRPYWVVTTYKNKIVWGWGEATGVVIVDAQNGKTEFYGVNDDIPDWVDVVQPKKFIEKQIDNWGHWVHGFWNFGNRDKTEKTDLTLTVYVDGDCYYFTGMTSVGSDDSCVGFIMVNTRTKESKICYMGGATESAAMKSAEGLVSDFGYTATEPLPLNVNGVETYVMALKDGEGLIKSYAMVNIKLYHIAAKGSTLLDTTRAYMQDVSQNTSTYVVSSDDAYGYNYEGIVERISSVVQDGSTYYYMILDGQPGKIFMASYSVSDELSITRDGDTVKVYYVDDSNGTVDIASFENVAFSVQVSDKQEERNKMDEGTSALEPENSQITDVNPERNEEILENMSDEEKSELLKDYLKQ